MGCQQVEDWVIVIFFNLVAIIGNLAICFGVHWVIISMSENSDVNKMLYSIKNVQIINIFIGAKVIFS